MPGERRRIPARLGFALGRGVGWTAGLLGLRRPRARLAGQRRPSAHAARLSPALARALASPDPARRRRALQVVDAMDGERAGLLLVEMLHDLDPGVRQAAVATAVRIGSQPTVFSLILALDDPVPEVREDARQAIRAITGKIVELDPLSDEDERRSTIEQLKRWWKETRMAQLAADPAVAR